ncbi:hypothetical protein Z947_2235 [Sulfitobacter geojensis]|nr:hypothetical protein Z947_2235 [Sulfitobacter geojensis]NYI29348.1 hypothetical protein [Sulfitobacter geojensis]
MLWLAEPAVEGVITREIGHFRGWLIRFGMLLVALTGAIACY